MEKRFPILGEIVDIPWSAIEPHRHQAEKNHYQTLERLAERGGLGWSEALAVLEDRHWCRIDEPEAKRKVLQIVSKKCIVCGKSLHLGRFAHNQNTCWECFKMEVTLMRDRIEEYPSWLWDKRDKHKEILNYMIAVVAEQFGEKW